MPRIGILVSVLIVGIYGPHLTHADLVSPYGGETAPNFTELEVNTDHVRVALEIDLSDYPVFVSEDDGSGVSLAERTGQTFSVSADGIPLDRVIDAVDVRPRLPRRTAASSTVPPRPRSDDVVFVEMRFPFSGQPERISFTPPLREDGFPLAVLGVLAKHMGVPVTDYRYLSKTETILPDWEDPWFSTFENPNLTRHHKSPVMSFLSMEPREVRHEIIFRLRDLEAWSDLTLSGTERLTPQDVADIKVAAASFVEARNSLVINGELSEPSSVSVSRIAVGAEGLQVLPDTLPADRTTMLLGVVLSYPQAALADTVSMSWELFPDGIDAVPVTLTDPAGGVPAQALRGDDTVKWTNHLKTWENPRTVPVKVKTASVISFPTLAVIFALISICAGIGAWRGTGRKSFIFWGASGLCLMAAAMLFPVKQTISMPGKGMPDDIASKQIVHGLLDNVSVAMLEPETDGINAAIAAFVPEESRDAVSAELQRGLAVTLPSGARARTDKISNVNIETITSEPDNDTHQILANWTSSVSGGHWGHLHRRAIAYRGLVDVSRSGDTWELDGLTVLSSKVDG
ncbi:MerC domain-containing protein [Ruegeria arenilitoris]|uniref:MerC domain-containing protein n=1 Tax=Ruegeria arenilitoris TaxID=1173585 RepID=UPI00147A135D|nr:MerC domain-containing protein [Ruegeria arenilitoris]